MCIRDRKKLQRRMYEHLSEKLEKDYSITLREREFVEEYEALLQTCLLYTSRCV